MGDWITKFMSKKQKHLSIKSLILLGFIFSLSIGAVFGVGQAVAAEPQVVVRDEAYFARFVSQSVPDPIEMEAGSTKVVTVKFKNSGTVTWDSASSRYLSAYTMEPRDRISEFKGANWLSGEQTAKIVGKIKPGEIGELKIELKAPEKIGDYTERFYLAAENYTWVKGGYFYFKIKVIPAKVVVEEPKSESTEIMGYQARRAVLTPRTVEGVGGQRIKVILSLQNTGSGVWKSYKMTPEESGFEDNEWEDAEVIFDSRDDTVANDYWRKIFYFRTPIKKGSYTARFDLQIDSGAWKETIEIPVEVTADASHDYVAPSFASISDNNSGVKETLRLATEPKVRVGINAPEGNFIQFRSYDDDYYVYSGGEQKGILAKRKFAVIKFSDAGYSFTGGDLNFTSADFVRLEPVNDPHAVFNAPNLDRTAKWVSSEYDFDAYHGVLEYRQGEVDKKMYLVNELFLEDYVKGMAENSKLAPTEFLKANLTAARNYAYVSRGKYPFFDVIANTYDQLYLGYEAEQVLPNVVAAAEATRGVMVTYQNQIITTPYFGNSSGWTKSWKSVWGGANKPWLVPVKCDYDTGKKQNGHGVGMSQLDAAYRADREGLSYIELLKYYYTGVEVEKVY